MSNRMLTKPKFRSYQLLPFMAIILLLLVACNIPAPAAEPQSEQPAETKSEAAAEGGVVLDVLGADYLAYPETSGKVEFSNCWGGSRVPLIETWIEEFNKIYPNIEVINDTVACSEILETQVTRLGGGDPPNALMIQSQNFPFFVTNDSALPLDEWVERDNVDLSGFYDAELGSRTLNGSVYGLPNVTAGAQHLLYFNTKLLDEVGWGADKPIETWQDLEALIPMAKEKDLFVMDPAKMPSGQTFFTALLYANGGRLWNDELTTIEFNSPEGVEAAEWYLNFIKAQADSYPDLAIAGDTRNVIDAATWGAEQYVTNPNGSWLIFQLNSDAPHVEYGITNFPRNADNPDSLGHTFVEGGWSFSIPKSASDQEAAWEWIKFITLTNFTCDFISAQVRPSPLKMCNEDPRLRESTPYWGQIEASLETAQRVPVTDIHPEFRELLFEMQDAIIFEQMSPAEAVETFAAQAQTMLDEWNESQ